MPQSAFAADARHECPIASDDAKKDGHLNTTDGAPAYGPITVSLTKTGDTSPASGLAVARFDTAAGGKISYERGSITVKPDIAKAIADGKAVVVVHGVDYNDNGKYDGAVKSELDPKLPTEATDPAICGVLKAAPAGGMATGAGGAAPSDGMLVVAPAGGVATGAGGAAPSEGMLFGGGILLAAVAGIGAVATRRSRAQA